MAFAYLVYSVGMVLFIRVCVRTIYNNKGAPAKSTFRIFRCVIFGFRITWFLFK